MEMMERTISTEMVAIGIWHPKHEINVQQIARLASCYGASAVIIESRRTKLALGGVDTTYAHRTIPFIRTDDIISACPAGAIPIAVEIVDRAECITTFSHPKSAFYIFGPEDSSIPASVLVKCKTVVSIPTRFCLNVAMAANVVLYDREAKRRVADAAWSDFFGMGDEK